jgi:TrmH family RNA methyltransferase
MLSRGSADPWGWKALRAAMGSTFRLPVSREDDVLGALKQLASSGLSVLATVPQNGALMYEVDLRRPAVLVLGGEGGGLTQDVLSAADELVTIPMMGAVESLNVAVAAALLGYEARRQRDATGPHTS